MSEQTTAPELPVWGEGAALAVVGGRPTRLEGEEKVTGRAVYTYDVRLPGQLYARVLRSPYPNARLLRIDTAAAERLPGVHAVLCAENAPQTGWYKDSELFDRSLRFVGDEVAAVAAESEEIADDALRLIEVDYEPLPFVTSIAEALRPGAPKVRPEGNLVEEPHVYQRGDLAAGFAAAEVIVEREYATETALHNCLEPHGTTASWEGDELALWSSTQSVFSVRQGVAERLGLPESKVRVIKQHMGGGFGAKQVAWKQDVIAALLAKASARPVQLMLDREAENLAVGNRNPTRQRVRLGALRDGTLTAIEARIEASNGAHLVGGEAAEVPGIYQMLYRCPNVRTEHAVVYTNTGPAVAFRAPGYVEGAFGLEQAMDELARELGLDPLALRLRNYAEEDQIEGKPYSSPDGLRRSYERAAKAFGWNGNGRGGNGHASATRAKRRGVGLAAHCWMAGGGSPPGYAWVKLNTDGTADVVTGTQDIGTGVRTGLAQVAAEELGLPLDRVSIHLGDTANGPYSPASAGSSTLSTIGPAVRAAAADAKAQLLHKAAELLETDAGKLEVRDGKVRVIGEPAGRGEEVAAVTGQIAPEMIQGRGERGASPDDVAVRTFGVQLAEVEVDTETGEVSVLRVVAAHDCGRIINPTLVESQVIGGVTQGVGYALSEERIVDAGSGVVLNANLDEYKIPTAADVPAIAHAAVDLPDPAANPLGAKGIGEPPVIPTAPAIANAVFDAVGVRVHHLPLSRSRVLGALAERNDAPAVGPSGSEGARG